MPATPVHRGMNLNFPIISETDIGYHIIFLIISCNCIWNLINCKPYENLKFNHTHTYYYFFFLIANSTGMFIFREMGFICKAW